MSETLLWVLAAGQAVTFLGLWAALDKIFAIHAALMPPPPEKRMCEICGSEPAVVTSIVPCVAELHGCDVHSVKITGMCQGCMRESIELAKLDAEKREQGEE